MILHNALQKRARIAKFLKSLLHLLQCFSRNFLSQHDFSCVEELFAVFKNTTGFVV